MDMYSEYDINQRTIKIFYEINDCKKTFYVMMFLFNNYSRLL